MTARLKVAVGFVMTLATQSALALPTQPVPVPEEASTAPQIDVTGHGLSTLEERKDADGKYRAPTLDMSDTSLQVGAAQRLFGGAVGSFGLGIVKTEADGQDPKRPPTFLHRAFVDYQSEFVEVLAGRSDNPVSHVVDLPTLRDDDLTLFAGQLNPFSDGAGSEDHLYSDQISVTLNQGMAFFENVHGQHLSSTKDQKAGAGLNSFGVTLAHLPTPGREAFDRLPAYGFGFERIKTDRVSANALNQAFVGGTLNLTTSVTNRLELRVQQSLTRGSDLTTLTTMPDTFEADSQSTAVAVVFNHRPFGGSGFQLALTGVKKSYTRIDDADATAVTFMAAHNLGQGFNAVAQYKTEHRDRNLAAAQTAGTAFGQSFELGLLFNFDAVINEHLSPRRSLLNQQYEFVPN